MNFLTDSELFLDLDENGQFIGKAKKGDTVDDCYQGGIRAGADNVRYKSGSTYGKKGWKSANEDWIFEVWEWGDSRIERFLLKKKKGITVGAFPPAVMSTGVVTAHTRTSSYDVTDKQVMHKAELEVDYFNNLSRCVERLGGESNDDYSLRGYFRDILQSREELSELLEDYNSMKKVCRWIIFVAVWVFLCISPTIPGMPPFMLSLIQAVAGKLGNNLTFVIFIAPIVLQLIGSFFRCGMAAEQYPALFILVFPVVPIAVGLCGVVGVLSAMRLAGSFDDILTWILVGIYLFWLLILFFAAIYVAHEEGKKRKELPALRKKFVKAVDANAEKIHRYIRLRVLWWKNLNGSGSLHYSLKNLQELLDQCVKEAEKYRQMK